MAHTYIGQGGMCKHRKSFKDILMIIIFYNCWPVGLKVKNTKQDLIIAFACAAMHPGTK